MRHTWVTDDVQIYEDVNVVKWLSTFGLLFYWLVIKDLFND